MSCSSIEGSEKEEDRDREEEEEEEETFMDLPVRSLATQKTKKIEKKDKFFS